MSREGDRHTISTRLGEVQVQKTGNGIRLDMPQPQGELTNGEARALGNVIDVMTRGPNIVEGGSQRSQSFNRDRDRS